MAVDEEPRAPRPPREDRGPREERAPREDKPKAPTSSFEASFEAELADEIGDLGPGGPSFDNGDGGNRRGPRPRRR